MVFSSSGSFALMPATGQEVSVDLWRALHDAEEALLHISESNDRVGESRGDLLESNGPVQHSARKENSDVNLATLRQEDLYEDHDIQPKTLFGGEELLAASVLGEQDKSAAAEDDLCQLPPDLLSKLIEDSDSKVQWDSSDNSSTVSCNLSDPLELNLWDERLWLSSRTFHLPFPQEIALPAEGVVVCALQCCGRVDGNRALYAAASLSIRLRKPLVVMTFLEKDLLEDLADSVEHHTTASWPSTPTNKQIDSRSSVKRPRVDAKSSRSFHPTQRSFSRRARRRLSAWLSLHDELAKYNVTLMGVLLDTQSKSHGTSIEALLPGLPTRCVRILFGLDEMYRHGLRPVSWFSDDFLHPHSYLAAEALAQLPIGRHLPHFSFASSLTDSLNVVENGKDLWPVRETLQRLADACMKLPATFPWTEKEKLILDWNSLRPRLFAPLTYLSTRTLLCSSSTVPNQQSLDEVHKLGRAQEIYEEIQESAAICVGELNTQRRLQDILYELYSLGLVYLSSLHVLPKYLQARLNNQIEAVQHLRQLLDAIEFEVVGGQVQWLDLLPEEHFHVLTQHRLLVTNSPGHQLGSNMTPLQLRSCQSDSSLFNTLQRRLHDGYVLHHLEILYYLYYLMIKLPSVEMALQITLKEFATHWDASLDDFLLIPALLFQSVRDLSMKIAEFGLSERSCSLAEELEGDVNNLWTTC
eukprot:gene8791-9695_t